jgi:hypothetical protein
MPLSQLAAAIPKLVSLKSLKQLVADVTSIVLVNRKLLEQLGARLQNSTVLSKVKISDIFLSLVIGSP